MSTHEAFRVAVAQAREAAKAYYDTGALLMSDADYDTLVERIEHAHAQHPDWDHEGVLDTVAAGASSGGDVTHPQPMGSLEKVKSMEEVEAFVSSIDGDVVVEPKLDGMAVRAEYRGGRLRLLATRGDGNTGENVSANAGLVSGLPDRLPFSGDVEIRGEVYMSDADFEYTTAARVASGKQAFANSRNAVAGTLRSTSHGHPVRMTFAAYDATFNTAAATYKNRMEQMRAWGVHVAGDLTGYSVTKEPAEVRKHIEDLGERRDTLGFPIDGAVIKANRDEDRDRLGHGTRAPKWAAAFKYAPNEATSVLRDIEVGVGRTGRITLRARIDQVTVGGTAITYATLHNPDFVYQQDLRIGQRVLVVRAGDVIPRVTAAVGEQDDSLAQWEAPQTCPQCGQGWDTSSSLWRCTTMDCSIAGRITYAVSRDCLDIMGMSDAICTALIDSGRVRDLADLLALTEDDLRDLPLGITDTGKTRVLGDVVAAKIAAEIVQARSKPLAKVLTSLGVRTLGRTLGRRVAAHFPTLAAVRAASEEELAAVDGIGNEKAAIIREDLERLAPMLDRLDLVLTTPTAGTGTGAGALSGMTVVVTGAMTGPLSGLSREQVHELIEQHGGKASGSVSAKTSLLVCSDPTSTKAVKAQALGIPVDTPEDFARRIGHS